MSHVGREGGSSAGTRERGGKAWAGFGPAKREGFSFSFPFFFSLFFSLISFSFKQIFI
jgi:hypothetical protein